jgi:isopenicillin N synthase-like dioxygenase
MKSDTIKNLSLLDLETDREKFTQELFEGLKECGFVVIRDHGISVEEMAKTYSLVERLFELPVKTKLQYDSGSGGARGYTAFGRENAAGNPHADLKEFWHVGQTLDANSWKF